MAVVCNRAAANNPVRPRKSAEDHARAPVLDARRALGRRGEDLAGEHLQRLGFRVLARNVRTRAGEIDLIVCDGRTLVFAEVKTRTARTGARPSADHEPLAGLRARQRRRMRRLALAWLSATDRRDRPAVQTIRFDAVGVTLDARGLLLRLDHVEGAW